MTSTASHSIKKRESPKDVFYTPAAVAKAHIALIPSTPSDVWFDPFRGAGAYYNNFPTESKEWCEIAEGKDFFAFSNKVDVICSNPPYSILDAVFKKILELKPRVVSLLFLHGAMTPRRMEMMNKAGYGITCIYTCKVWKWYGMTEAYVFEQGKDNNCCRIVYDRTVYRVSSEEAAAQKKATEKL